MKTQEKLIQALLAAFPTETETAIAARAGLTIARFSNYKKGLRHMDDDAVIGAATAVGWNVQKTLADHKTEIASTARERQFWRQLGAAAAIALCVMPFAGIPQARAISAVSDFSGMYIMLIRKWLRARLGTGHAVAVMA